MVTPPDRREGEIQRMRIADRSMAKVFFKPFWASLRRGLAVVIPRRREG